MALTAKELDNFQPAQPSLDDDLSGSADRVNLKPLLGEIQTDRDSLHSRRLLSVGVHRRPRCGTSMPGSGGRPPHQDRYDRRESPGPALVQSQALQADAALTFAPDHL
jgi:hypothetical protein